MSQPWAPPPRGFAQPQQPAQPFAPQQPPTQPFAPFGAPAATPAAQPTQAFAPFQPNNTFGGGGAAGGFAPQQPFGQPPVSSAAAFTPQPNSFARGPAPFQPVASTAAPAPFQPAATPFQPAVTPFRPAPQTATNSFGAPPATATTTAPGPFQPQPFGSAAAAPSFGAATAATATPAPSTFARGTAAYNYPPTTGATSPIANTTPFGTAQPTPAATASPFGASPATATAPAAAGFGRPMPPVTATAAAVNNFGANTNFAAATATAQPTAASRPMPPTSQPPAAFPFQATAAAATPFPPALNFGGATSTSNGFNNGINSPPNSGAVSPTHVGGLSTPAMRSGSQFAQNQTGAAAAAASSQPSAEGAFGWNQAQQPPLQVPAYDANGYPLSAEQQQQWVLQQNQLRAQQQAAYEQQRKQQAAAAAAVPAKPPKRIDSAQIPRPAFGKAGSPIVTYYTRSGQSPPAANSDYVVIDEGNASPRYLRLTTNQIANDAELIDSTKLCIGAIIQPLANPSRDEEPVPVVDYPEGPLRCTRCKAYVNPFFNFIDGGAKFICNICEMKNDVPDAYRCNLDANGFRRDKMERAELCRGSVEFVAPAAFLQKPIQDPCYLFVLDVSSSSIATGCVSTAVQAIRQSLDALARNPRLRAGIITYDSALHFYSLKPPRTEPQMYVVSDVEDVFVPCPADELLVPVSEAKSRALLDATLDMIGNVFSTENPNSNKAAAASAKLNGKDAKDTKTGALPQPAGFQPFGQPAAAATPFGQPAKPAFSPFGIVSPTAAAGAANAKSADSKDAKSAPATFGLLPGEQSGEDDNAFGSALGAAATAANLALNAFGGKVLLIQSHLPQVGTGSLQARDNQQLYYTDKEKTLFVPQTAFYDTLSTSAAEAAVSFDLFVCANSYCDIATVGALANKTGGQLFMYPGFHSRKDGEALQRDVFHTLTRRTGCDAVMVVRVSTGLKVAEHFGNYFHRRPNEMDLPTIDCDKSFGIRLEHEGKIKEDTEVCIQCALLYTNEDGQRRLRVHTISVPVTSVMSNIFRYADLDSIINLSLKQAVKQIFTTTTPDEAQTALTSACVDSLFVYRKFCAAVTSAGQLILPEPLKLLPLCTLGLIKHPLFQAGLSADERAFLFAYVTAMPTYVSVAFVCPRLFNLAGMEPDACIADAKTGDGRLTVPKPLTLSSESLAADGLYLLDNARYMYIWISEKVSKQLILDVFGVDRDKPEQRKKLAQHYQIQNIANDPTHPSSRVTALIQYLRRAKPNFQNLQIIARQTTKTNESGDIEPDTLDESLFFAHLIEDGAAAPKPDDSGSGAQKEKKVTPNTMSYIDFLCWIHKRIQNKFF